MTLHALLASPADNANGRGLAGHPSGSGGM